MKNIRLVRRKITIRLEKARKAGRGDQEFLAMEREDLAWWKQLRARSKPRRKAAQ